MKTKSKFYIGSVFMKVLKDKWPWGHFTWSTVFELLVGAVWEKVWIWMEVLKVSWSSFECILHKSLDNLSSESQVLKIKVFIKTLKVHQTKGKTEASASTCGRALSLLNDFALSNTSSDVDGSSTNHSRVELDCPACLLSYGWFSSTHLCFPWCFKL